MLDEKIVDHHCKAIRARMDKFRALYFDKGRTFFDKLVPADAPTTVVYPFGGGDMLSALVAFPSASEITTISLELAGDPRRIERLTPAQLETSLVAGGYEPVSMRYFTLDDAGEIHYLDAAGIAALDTATPAAKGLKHDWLPPTFSPAFSNVEIQYRRIGETGENQIRVHRHIGWNLGNDYMRKHPQLIRHLEKKGPDTVLVKGASYLLWRGDFSRIREYILDHLEWMLSDSTGIPPKFARPAGMIQETYGDYNGAFLEGAQQDPHDQEMIEL